MQEHRAICDVCNFDIVDIRYKCLNCKDFDICKYCELELMNIKPHNLYHIFLKLERLKIGLFKIFFKSIFF